jgi:tetratricopeptide (TPR) repeat protein
MKNLSVDRALLKAKSHIKKGEFEEAQKLYQAVLQTFPKNKRAQKGLATLNKPEQSTSTQGPPQETINQLVNLCNQGQLVAAVEQAQVLTEQYTDAFIIWNILGAAHQGLGKTIEASEAFKKVIKLNPNYAEGHSNLGLTLKDQGKLEEAIEAYNKALAIKPDYAEVCNNMGITLQEQGKLSEAIVSYKKALSLKPDYAYAHNNMGVTLQEQDKLEEAMTSYNKALSLKPDYAEAHYNMGNALKEQGKFEEAITSYNKALSLKPDYADAYNNMGVTLQEQDKLEEVITSYNKALSLKPDYAEAHYNMGNALKEQGKFEEAITSYNKALSLKPDYAEAHNNLGVILKEQGKFEEAITSYNIVLSLKPGYAEAHRNLSSLIKYKPDNTQVALVGEMIKRPDLKDDDRCHLQYTYAKMNEDLGDLDSAYDNYSSGGKLRQKLLSYDFKQDELTFEKIKNTGPKLKEFAFSKPFHVATNTPIFILGMPRSGTTLVEQIISNHSEVHGAGELTFLNRFANSSNIYNQTISSDNILGVRKNYLNELEKVSHNKPFVTDKMPQNFLHISMILKALPEAKVIHVKRDPAATCWSNFKHYFSSKGMGYSYDLKDTVSYFKLYEELMDFWDQQYSDQIYHLDYDKLTVEQEPETRKLIEYLELGWEDDCLSPHKNKRSVRTASQQQVREKVYTGSSQAWRKFEQYLNGVFDEFEHSSTPPLK